MRTRNHDWMDTVKGVPVYGVQVLHDGRWKHAAINGEPIWCDTQEERDRQRMKLRGLLREQARKVPNAL